MKVLVVLCAVVAGCLANPGIGYAYSAISPLTAYSSIAPIIPLAAPVVPVAPAAVKTQYHAQDELGQAKYGHSEPLSAHDAVQDAQGNKIGSFSYVDPEGRVHSTSYIADADGYRVISNNLPLAPAVPLPVLHRRRRQAWGGPQASPVVTPTGHLQETPEVAAAKAAHFAEHARQNSQTQPQAPQWGQQRSSPTWGSGSWNQQPATTWAQSNPIVTSSGAIPDTPEVAAARAAHFAEHARQNSQAQPQAPQWDQQRSSQTWGSPVAQDSGLWNQQSAANWGQANPQVGPSGTIADTPEVAAARAAHFAEHARVAAANPSESSATPQSWNQAPVQSSNQAPAQSWSPAPQSWDQSEARSWNGASAQSWKEPAQSWNGASVQSWNQAPAAPAAPAVPTWSQATSRAADPAWNQGSSNAPWGQAPAANPWGQSNPQVSPSGTIAETPEVAAARAAHFAEHARVAAATPTESPAASQSWNQAPSQSWNQAPSQSWNQAPAARTADWGPSQWNTGPAQFPAQSWNQPSASWDQSPSGGVPETPEVAAARAAHLAEHAATARRQ